MAYLEINQDKVTTESAKQLQALCPFGAITGQGKSLSITAACRMCRLCVKKGPEGVVRWVEEEAPASVDKKEWRGIAVYAEHDGESIHPVTLELLGKARELADWTSCLRPCNGKRDGKTGGNASGIRRGPGIPL